MWIKNIKIKNFRNYNQEEINLEKNINIFYGKNAQGKTNIIEAIFLCSLGKSFRAKKDNEMIKLNEENAIVEIEYEKSDRDGKIKIEIGCAYKREEEKTMRVTGRNLITGLPYAIEVSSSEMLEALDECVEQIVVTAHVVLEKTPPELAADISDRGIIMTGGGSLLYGLDKRIEERTGIKVIVANEPLSCVAAGTGKALSSIDLLKSGGTFNKK